MLKDKWVLLPITLAASLLVAANTTVLTLTYSILARPLPFEDPTDLVQLWGLSSSGSRSKSSLSWQEFETIRDRSQSLHSAGALEYRTAASQRGDLLQAITVAHVTSRFFATLGVSAEIGRVFGSTDEGLSGPRPIVISHRLFASQFGGDKTALEDGVLLDSARHPVVGVLPRDYEFGFRGATSEVDFWMLLPSSEHATQPPTIGRTLTVLARLKPGTTLESANEEIALISRSLHRGPPASDNSFVGAFDFRQEKLGRFRKPLLTLYVSLVLVVLIGIVNFSLILLSKEASRRAETSLRAALGASSSSAMLRSFRQGFSTVMVGGASGLILAVPGVELLRRSIPEDVPRNEAIALDQSILLLSLLSLIVIGSLSALLPAFYAKSVSASEATSGGGRIQSLGQSTSRVLSALVSAQIGLALVLAIGSVLLLRSFWQLTQSEPGFKHRNLSYVSVRLLPRERFSEPAARSEAAARLVRAARQHPGIVSASAGLFYPFGFGYMPVPYSWEGIDSIDEERTVGCNYVAEGYFATLHVPLLQGRAFQESDAFGTEPVAVVSQSFARSRWGAQPPVGKMLALSEFGSPIQRRVIGVVGDIKVNSLESEFGRSIYVPFRQRPQHLLNILISSRGAPPFESLKSSLAQAVPGVRFSSQKRFSDLLSSQTEHRRSVTVLLTVFGVLGISQALAGIYGVVGFQARRRLRQAGIRIALGAPRLRVELAMLRGVLAATAVGLAVGFAAALGLTRFLESWLFGLTPNDPATFVAVSLLMCLASLAAALLSLRRVRVDDVVALLRSE